MCYDVSFTVSIERLSDYFDNLKIDQQLAFEFPDLTHVMGNFVFPAYPIVFRAQDDKDLHATAMEWGVLTYYAKTDLDKMLAQFPEDKDKAFKEFDKKIKGIRNSMLNARSERILDDPKSYWYKIRNRRCLIPVTGIYEHREVVGWKNKIPYLIGLKHQPVFFIPGLYSVAELPDKDTGEMHKHWTFTLITRGANELLRKIHNHGDNKWRMPLFLPLTLSQRWLDHELPEQEYRAILEYEMPAEEMEDVPVFTIRSPKPRPDGLAKDAPYEWAGLPPLGVGDPQ
jgi:putative SOS response-associated peptidase YedK